MPKSNTVALYEDGMMDQDDPTVQQFNEEFREVCKQHYDNTYTLCGLVMRSTWEHAPTEEELQRIIQFVKETPERSYDIQLGLTYFFSGRNLIGPVLRCIARGGRSFFEDRKGSDAAHASSLFGWSLVRSPHPRTFEELYCTTLDNLVESIPRPVFSGSTLHSALISEDYDTYFFQPGQTREIAEAFFEVGAMSGTLAWLDGLEKAHYVLYKSSIRSGLLALNPEGATWHIIGDLPLEIKTNLRERIREFEDTVDLFTQLA